ncbi:MAG: hypothetical protein ACI4M6_04805 [Christensenellaceae bacterium]
MANKDSEQLRKRRRRNFFISLKEYSKRNKANRNFSEKYSEICEDESVRIRVNAEGGLYSPYSDKRDLDTGMLDYIESTAYTVPIDRPLTVSFSSVPEEERENVAATYKKYFELKFNDKCLDLKICYFKAILLLILGFIFFGCAVAFSRFNVLWGLNEICTVAASFTMWESVDFFLLERSNIKAEKLDAAQLLLAKIEFI